MENFFQNFHDIYFTIPYQDMGATYNARAQQFFAKDNSSLHRCLKRPAAD